MVYLIRQKFVGQNIWLRYVFVGQHFRYQANISSIFSTNFCSFSIFGSNHSFLLHNMNFDCPHPFTIEIHYSVWNQWSVCDKCKRGKQTRHRDCLQNGIDVGVEKCKTISGSHIQVRGCSNTELCGGKICFMFVKMKKPLEYLAISTLILLASTAKMI